ncbi:MAG: flagellar brake protein [Bacillota bacterium]
MGILKVNQRVEIARRGEDEYYPALVQDVGEHNFCINMPYRQGVPLILVPGERVDVRLVEKDATYFFTATVLGRRRDRIPLYVLSLPVDVRRVQRRRFVRLETLLDVWYAPAPEGDAAPAFVRARAVDLSAGGMCLVTKQPLEVGAPLLLRFHLDLGEREAEIVTPGRVVRRVVGPEDDLWQGGYRYGIEFVGLPMREQDLIVRYIFRKMAERGKLR